MSSNTNHVEDWEWVQKYSHCDQIKVHGIKIRKHGRTRSPAQTGSSFYNYISNFQAEINDHDLLIDLLKREESFF